MVNEESTSQKGACELNHIQRDHAGQKLAAPRLDPAKLIRQGATMPGHEGVQSEARVVAGLAHGGRTGLFLADHIEPDLPKAAL